MTIHIHRGQHQIGGSIIEITDGHTRLFFDIGINLDENKNTEVPAIEGLFCGETDCNGVFISHYHADHIGLAENLVDDVPVFMGENAYNILTAAANYRETVVPFTPHFVFDREPIVIDAFTITPFLCDHSAFDSYMFLIENDGKTVLYTGDFRANGRLDFDALLADLPTVDVLITEGTTLTRDGLENIQEELLEDIAVNYIRDKKGPAFILMSAQNIDRLITAQHIADRTDRVFLQDLYTAQIAKSCGVLSENARVFMTGGDKQYAQLQAFSAVKIGKHEIAETSFLMCIRPSMKRYLSKLNDLVSFEDGVLFYGMWKGYADREDMKTFLDEMTAKGVTLHTLHTSGHADSHTIEAIIRAVRPKTILPIHTENTDWFDKFATDAAVVKHSVYEW